MGLRYVSAGLFFQDQATFEPAPVRLLFGNLEDKFFRLGGQTPNEARRAARGAATEDFHSLGIQSPGPLNPGTAEALEFPLLAIQIQNCAGGRSAAIRLHAIHRKYLSFGVPFKADHQTGGVRIR
jgi:hypothetical protein